MTPFCRATLWIAFACALLASWLPAPMPVREAFAQAAFGFAVMAALVAVSTMRGK